MAAIGCIMSNDMARGHMKLFCPFVKIVTIV